MKIDTDDVMLPVVPAAELDQAEPQRRWLVEQLWARAGVGIIGGHPKLGKSWLGLDLAVSVASGTPCLDTFSVAEPGGALIYMAEDAAPVVKQRLEGICRHRGIDLATLPIGVITEPSMRLDLQHDQRRLVETIRHHAPRLLLLDPFVRLHRINENQASDVAALLGYLRQLQRAHDLAVAVVHHARKNGGSASGGQALRGSGDFFAWVDTALSLRRQRQRLLLSVEHRAAGAPQPIHLALAGSDSDMHLVIVHNTQNDEQHSPRVALDLDNAVLDVLDRAANHALPRPALRAALCVRNQRLGQALRRLADSGQIARRGDAWVRLPIPVPTTTDTPSEPERERTVAGA